MEANNTALLVIDMQERLMKAINDQMNILNAARKLIKVSNLLKLEILYSEQNPSKLGKTDNTLIFDNQNISKIISKMSFSCFHSKEILSILQKKKIQNIILCGVESHICVQQTALDLKKSSFNVFLPIDSIGSRNLIDHETSIRRMENAGVIISSVESIIFELCKTAARKEFKPISNIIKEG